MCEREAGSRDAAQLSRDERPEVGDDIGGDGGRRGRLDLGRGGPELVAEFESELGIDYRARARAAYEEKRWQVIKTIIVWTIALMFFTIACYKLWLMGLMVDEPFSDLDPMKSLFGE